MVASTDNRNSTQTSDYFQKKSISTENLPCFGFVRKYMNGAVYIESPADVPNGDLDRKKRNYKNEVIPIKRVSCSCTSVSCCKIHENEEKNKETQANCNGGKQENKTMEKKNHLRTSSEEDLKLSIRSLATSAASSDSNGKQKENGYRKWILKKNEEKKRIEENKVYIQEHEEREKQKRLDQERENFRRWLANKKKEEEKRRIKQEEQLEEEKIKEAQKERRSIECKLRYQLWLKKKEQEELEKKIKEQMAIIKTADDRQRRTEENEKAYRAWLESSKTKPKPIPLSQGLESLRSSVSVTYINPVPWSPNIEEKAKPVSQ